MNTISKIHQHFSDRLNNSRVLENPEEFLGENYEAVLNFWLIIDDLSQAQLRVVNEREEDFFNENYSEWRKVKDLTWGASEEVVQSNYAYHAGGAARVITNSVATDWATLELIAMHKILEVHQKPLTFFNMFINL